MTKGAFARNLGLVSQSEQDRLAECRVAIAGVGGVGGRLATRLAALGIRSFAIADPDTFDVSNINRQEGADFSNVGRLKVDVLAEKIKAISPDANVDVWPLGINDGNLADFIRGADLAVEGIDYLQPGIGVRLARAARTNDIPMVLGVEVGFGAVTSWFPADGRFTYEEFLGLSRDVSLADLDSGTVTAEFRRWVPHVPSYARLEVFAAVASGDIPAPAIAPAVDLCGAMLCTLIFELLAATPGQRPAPSVFYSDLRERRARSVRLTTLHHYSSLAKMVLRNKTGRN